MLKPLFIIFFIFSININCYSQEEYFLTLRNDEVNLRQGPSKKYPVKLVYKKKFLPVLVYDMSDNFRKIRDHENNSGWIHLSQLSKKKAAIVISKELILFKNPTVYSKPIAILKNGRLGKIIKCKDVWCKIVCEEYKGWVKRDGLWGLL